jgi:hypothetical protein
MLELAPEDQELIDCIKARAQDPNRATVYPPVTVAQISDAEKQLGFHLPALVREIYLQVGNGGFGPGYGITGLAGGYEIYDFTLVDNCLISRDAERDFAEFGMSAPGWHWEHQYIMYCYWGCNVTSIIDCSQPSIPVYTLDTYALDRNEPPALHQWWRDWLDGKI